MRVPVGSEGWVALPVADSSPGCWEGFCCRGWDVDTGPGELGPPVF